MVATADAAPDELGGDPDAVIRQLYSQYAKALHGYVEQFCPDRASADDIMQETFNTLLRLRTSIGLEQRVPQESAATAKSTVKARAMTG